MTFLEPVHAHAMAHIHASCFPPPWGKGQMEAGLQSGGAFAMGLKLPGQGLVGFVLARVMADEAEILTIGMMPSVRRQGLATRLMRAALDEAARKGALGIFLEVAVENMAAIALYTALGFEKVGRRTGYYDMGDKNPIDALVMRRSLA